MIRLDIACTTIAQMANLSAMLDPGVLSMGLKTASCFNVDIAAIEESLASVSERWNPTTAALSALATKECLTAPAAAALLSSGKRMRPLMTVWTYRNLVQDFSSHLLDMPLGQRVLLIATACEMLHAASLVVDDVQDGSVERRGKPSVFAVHGIDVAINAGSWMYFEAQQLMAECGLLHESVELLRNCHRGQALDLSTSRSAIVTAAVNSNSDDLRRLYREIAEMKTGELLRFGVSAVSQILEHRAQTVRPNTVTLGELSTTPPQTKGQESISHDHRMLVSAYGFLYQKIDDFRNLSLNLSPQKACEDLASIRNCVTIELIRLLNSEERALFLRAHEAGALRQWILSHEKFRSAMEIVRDSLELDLSKCESMANRLCLDPRSKAYLEKVMHAPLSNLVRKVTEEYDLQTVKPERICPVQMQLHVT